MKSCSIMSRAFFSILKIEPMEFINELRNLNPRVFHLTDGDFNSELDSHLHYGAGSFPLKDLLALVPDGGMVTNEAKRFNLANLNEFKEDSDFLCNLYTQLYNLHKK